MTSNRDVHKTMLRIDRSLHESLAVAAETNGRTVNQQIIWYIRQGLRQCANPADPIVPAEDEKRRCG